jgi:hypothetical protein
VIGVAVIIAIVGVAEFCRVGVIVAVANGLVGELVAVRDGVGVRVLVAVAMVAAVFAINVCARVGDAVCPARLLPPIVIPTLFADNQRMPDTSPAMIEPITTRVEFICAGWIWEKLDFCFLGNCIFQSGV